MILIHKIYRGISDLIENLCSQLRRLHLKLKYPSLKLDRKSFISRNCVIQCMDGAICDIRSTYFGAGTFIVVEKGATLVIDDAYVGPNCVIVAKTKIEIGKHCSIAEMVVIRDQDHNYGEGKRIKESGENSAPVIIGENVWIGAKATVLQNVTIGSNSVIGAHSLVNKSFPQNSVIAGIPAVLIKSC